MSGSWHMVKGHLPLCHGCQSWDHFKKDCAQAEHPNVEMKAAGEEEAAAKVVSVSSSTKEVELVTETNEEVQQLRWSVK